MMAHMTNRERHMKHFMIRYEFRNGTTEAWHQEIGRFIKAIEGDPELKGRIGYRVLKNRDDASYFHLASVTDEAAQKALQSRDFFKAYQEMTRKVAGGEVTVAPIEWIDQTA
uniref:ABM domain-containing protein n=2 Tax=Bradyrhizobium barranii subsp. barranii TaxID=2823807 RepID=A0A939LYW6_9BRAD